MDKQKLKSEFHKLIDDFEDIETLENIYEGMKNIKTVILRIFFRT